MPFMSPSHHCQLRLGRIDSTSLRYITPHLRQQILSLVLDAQLCKEEAVFMDGYHMLMPINTFRGEKSQGNDATFLPSKMAAMWSE